MTLHARESYGPTIYFKGHEYPLIKNQMFGIAYILYDKFYIIKIDFTTAKVA